MPILNYNKYNNNYLKFVELISMFEINLGAFNWIILFNINSCFSFILCRIKIELIKK